MGACSVLVALGSGCEGGSTEPIPIETYGTCNALPNYVADPGLAGLNRFPENPVPVFVDMSDAPADLRQAYTDGVREGVVRWGRARLVSDVNAASVRIYLRSVSPDASIYARTIHDASKQPPFLTGGEIHFNVHRWVGTDDRVRSGDISREALQADVAATAAHEMGHVLGIIGHASVGGLLMSAGGSSEGVPTQADLNTMSHAYCR